ncbi:von Willebrand factor type A domain protein [Rhodopirellula maiorica SM1]|uniref:von Willebrand factor type A domain protein n=1 Tax=Rhodopirellula maiorica SM1 TaxID=1265738 RepID=M5RQB2_9BACT|nr:von Willebrand factor type A domain-containing protein [Rhodopirellula maiorica]EMI21391.1 von Willebrand factor type A domain protein [Rhodopirellula maiorica SM1]
MKDEPNKPLIDPELEARIVALVLGEASDFERDQLQRLMDENAELAAFKNKIENVHGLMRDVGEGEWDTTDEHWKLPAEKRNAVLAFISGQTNELPEIRGASKLGTQPSDAVSIRRRNRRRILSNVFKVAAVLLVAVFGLSMAVPSVQHARVATRTEKAPASIDHFVDPLESSYERGTVSGFEAVIADQERDYSNNSKSALAAIEDSLSTNKSLPTPYYLQDDVQYFPTSPEFKLSQEVEKLGERELTESVTRLSRQRESGRRSELAQPTVDDLALIPQGVKSSTAVEFGDESGFRTSSSFESEAKYFGLPSANDSKRVSSSLEGLGMEDLGSVGQPLSASEPAARGLRTKESWQTFPEQTADVDFSDLPTRPGRIGFGGAVNSDAGESGQMSSTDGLSSKLDGGIELQFSKGFSDDAPIAGKDLDMNMDRGDARKWAENDRYSRFDAADPLPTPREKSKAVKSDEVFERLGRSSDDKQGTVYRYVKPPIALDKKRALQTNEPARTTAAPIVSPAGLDEKNAAQEAFSTFSLHISDVSFKLARAALASGSWPEPAKVRIEEFVNAFDYGDPMPSRHEKVACRVEQSIHPFLQQRNLLRVSMRTAAEGRASETPLRLTFLLDNSGSMERIDRQQTVRRAFALLAQQLKTIDQVTLISFARQPRLLADKVSGDQSSQLVELVDKLPSEGGTNLESALQLAFEKAQEQHTDGAQNRVILLTDGAVNLGDANPERLSEMITTMRVAGIAFDAAGISADGLNDEILEALARKGDGRYYLLDSLEAADDGFARQIAGALRPSAKNVKVQVEFNPKRVGRYKLLGFEKHRLKQEDFRDDNIDAAEMAAAEAGVALYQFEAKPDGEGDVGSVSVRFRDLSSGQMIENRWPIPYEPNAPRLERATPSLRIAGSAALFAAKLRGDALAENVDLKTLSNLIAGLPEQSRNSDRVAQLQLMIQQARQVVGE